MERRSTEQSIELQDIIITQSVNEKEKEKPVVNPTPSPYDLPGRDWREKIFLLFEDSHSSRFAWILSIFVILTIFISITNFIVSSLPQYWLHTPPAVSGIQIYCVAVFTIEYLARLITAPKWYRWIIRPMNLVDLAAILPFYLELVLQYTLTALGIIRAMRVVRLARLFKASKYSKKMLVISETFKRSADTLLLLIMLMLVSVITFGTLIFYAEQTGQHFDSEKQQWIKDSDGLKSSFQSIPDSLWWVIVTMCRVPGYGAAYPSTPLGKLVAALASLAGILLIAFPVAVLGANFRDQWTLLKQQKTKKKAKQTKETS